MTPSTTLTMEGFLRGLQGQSMGLIGTIIALLVILWLIHSFIGKAEKSGGLAGDEAQTMRRWSNWIVGILFILTLIFFGVSAMSYATNVIPRAGLDGTSVYEQMDSNVQKQ